MFALNGQDVFIVWLECFCFEPERALGQTHQTATV